jgi:uncharacterized protein (TIGR03437 family)
MICEIHRQRLPLGYVQGRVRILKPVLTCLALIFAGNAFAQTYPWDSSGNGLLKGTYYFREAVWVVGSNDGSLGEAVAAYGQITFDGNGNYTTTAALYDAGGPTLTSNYNISGTYSIAASGYGFLSSPVSSGDSVYGLVSQGIFIGNSTENQTGFNDLFIAAPLPSPTPGLSSLKGNYTLLDFDMPATGSPTEARDMAITLAADGNGNLTGVNASGYIGLNGSTAVRQSLGSLKYIASNGAFNLHFGGSFTTSNIDTTLITGDHFLYISPDGNFVFGGSPTGWDMIVGIRNGSGAPNFSGLYYQAGMDEDVSTLASGFGNTDNYFGSLKSLGNNTILGHQRIISTALFSATATNVYDSTYTSPITINADGTADDSVQHYYFTNGGAIRIGVGKSSLLGVSIALAGPTFTPPSSAPYIDPTGISNTASSALFTTSTTAGELITIYGSNLAADSLQDATFPTTLDGAQIMVNGALAPILSVNKCGPYPCATFMMPYEVSGATANPNLVAQIQLFNKGVASNMVTAWVSVLSDGTAGTAPGIFTFPAGGIGYAAAQHTTDFSLVTPQSPAKPGEAIAVYLTGLGPMNPAVADGAPGPVPAANAVAGFTVAIGGVNATTSFIGLTPQVSGLGQINLVIPAGIPAGDQVLEVAGPDSDTFQALISIGTGNARPGPAVTAEPATRLRRSNKRPLGGAPTGFRRILKFPTDR